MLGGAEKESRLVVALIALARGVTVCFGCVGAMSELTSHLHGKSRVRVGRRWVAKDGTNYFSEWMVRRVMIVESNLYCN